MYQKIKLKNGARVLLVPQHETKAVTVLVLFKIGSRYESEELNGVSHFIEHMMFKGTKKRPTTLDISKDLDKVGAEFNAFTGKDHTGYYIKINYKKIDLAIDILHDMLYNSKFDKNELDRERTVIIEEINMYEDNPMMHIDELFEELLYGGHPLARRIAGPRKNIKNISRQKMLQYKNKFYSPDNMVVVIAGNISDDIIERMKNNFAVVKKSSPKLPRINRYKLKSSSKPELKIHYKETEQVQLSLGFPAYKKSDPKINALALLAIILGGNMSSRLFVNIREKKGLAYFVSCQAETYEDIGNLMIRSGLDKSRIEEALKSIVFELKRIKNKGVSKSELKNAKEYIRGKTTLKLEDSSSLAGWFASQELLDKEVLTPEEKFAKIDRVRLKDIKRAARDIIKENMLKAVIIGPFTDQEQKNLQKLLKF